MYKILNFTIYIYIYIYIYIKVLHTNLNLGFVSPRPALGHSLGDSLIHPIFITKTLLVQPKG